MTRIVYINGSYLHASEAKISVFDRGFLYADSVYEVIPVYHDRPLFLNRHLRRLANSLSAVNIPSPTINWSQIIHRLIEKNGGGDLQIYLQITRGNSMIRKLDADDGLVPTVVAFTIHNPYPKPAVQKSGIRAKLVEDIRWERCDIKSTALLGAILVNQQALTAKAETAILHRNGYLTEGASCNVFIIDSSGCILTPPLNNTCLAGITREVVLELLVAKGIDFKEVPIPVESIFLAKEVWATSTTKEIYPVTCIDNYKVGPGIAGPIWEKINGFFQQWIAENHE